jgi:hypothetical protein
MKRILNLNSYAWKIMLWIAVFAFLIPAILVLCTWLIPISDTALAMVNSVMQISILAGIILFTFFLILVLAEQVQDGVYDRVYRKNRQYKLMLGDGSYECQFCGNRKVAATDRQCSVCGKELK